MEYLCMSRIDKTLEIIGATVVRVDSVEILRPVAVVAAGFV
jgi:hypothetical protein